MSSLPLLMSFLLCVKLQPQKIIPGSTSRCTMSGCFKACEPGWVYCSELCIVRHAEESLRMIREHRHRMFGSKPKEVCATASIHHLNRCQTITLCRGSRPRIPSRLKNEMTQPTTGHEVPLVKPEKRDLQRTPNDRNLHDAFEPP